MEHGIRLQLCEFRNNIRYKILFLLCGLIFAMPTWGVVNQLSAWTILTGNWVSPKYPWLHYYISGELRSRFINVPTIEGLGHAGIGAALSSTFLTFVGYRGVIEHSCEGSNHENSVWEECLWKAIGKEHIDFFIRPRLIQRKRVGESQWNHQLRQRFAWFFKDGQESDKRIPYISDELFINLNRPSWSNGQGLDQNRLLVGCLFIINKRIFIDLGYMNQYRLRTPHNVLTHILLARAEYNF